MILTLLVSASFVFICLLLQSEWRGRQLAYMTCEQLMAELHPVKMEHIALVAVEYATLCHRSDGINVWSIIGGLPGLLRMYSNTGFLLALAQQATSWNSSESTGAQERIEKDVLLMRRAALHTLYRRAFGQRPNAHLGEAVIAYHAMTELLLTLYERSPSRLYTRLATALGQV